MSNRSDTSAGPLGWISRRQVVAGAAIAMLPRFDTPALFAAQLPPVHLPPPTGSLRARAEAKGLIIGATYDAKEFGDARMKAALHDNNMLVPENGFNMTRVMPTPGAQPNYGEVMPVWDLAREIGAGMRLHDLVYDRTTPKWVADQLDNLPPAATEKFLVGYIDRILADWGDKVAHIEVVNEPGYDLSDMYRSSIFTQKLGMGYLDVAYHAAHAAAPHAMLFVNAAVLEPDEHIFDLYRRGMIKLLEGMRTRGTPIHALGMEAHLMTERAFSQQVVAEFIGEVTAMGIKVMITELDVNDRGITGDIPTRDAACAALTKAFLDVALSFRDCIGLINFNLCDKYSWLRGSYLSGDAPGKRQRTDGLPLRPTLLDDNYQRKPMWSAVAAALDAAPAR